MSIEVKVPVLPESVSDAIIAGWHKKPGDPVRRDENLVDLETDKVVLEVPAPVDGVLKEILRPTGETVTSEELIAVIEEGASAPAPTPAASAPAAAAAPAASGSSQAAGEPSPSARRVMAEHGIEGQTIEGTGRGGRVTKEDAVKAASQPAAKSGGSSEIAKVAGTSLAMQGQRAEQRVP
ncbi:MAG: E3 binding domain-containing protein, partial [Xanthomonadales bacterium]|nr:E3 binding domain-containing protein [Xanthomonadales bacterium]